MSGSFRVQTVRMCFSAEVRPVGAAALPRGPNTPEAGLYGQCLVSGKRVPYNECC